MEDPEDHRGGEKESNQPGPSGERQGTRRVISARGIQTGLVVHAHAMMEKDHPRR
ncbi:hypothetical protein MUO32_03815 [Shinella sp. CPCC 101442]|uniref:hypothetical protein n=1 Tax=Shinella sp. CPCC 101442 TaxID=2932265 RepID=UPI002152A06B|nr:hypothetical protein [Shinella sp. CPCC 101442]MCR6498154.1 hypothetical protein [Shinella sp. CPCC 101442]